MRQGSGQQQSDVYRDHSNYANSCNRALVKGKWRYTMTLSPEHADAEFDWDLLTQR
jgi:hypothetical protein